MISIFTTLGFTLELILVVWGLGAPIQLLVTTGLRPYYTGPYGPLSTGFINFKINNSLRELGAFGPGVPTGL